MHIAAMDRAALHHRLVATFSAQPEISGIYVFGREVDGQVDRYSDIDMFLCSTDLALTQCRYLDLLSSVSPVMGTYTIVATEEELAQMILFRDASPYQKLDLSISASHEKPGFGPFKSLYRNATLAPTSSTRLTVNPAARSSLQNRLNDILFSIPRFTKCLFRQDHDMYRRWTGVTEALATLLFESHFGWSREPRPRLSPPEYKKLHTALTAAEQMRLCTIQPLDGQPDLSTSFTSAISWIAELYTEKARAMNEELSPTLTQHLVQFLASEIARFEVEPAALLTAHPV